MPNFNQLNVNAFDDIAWEGSAKTSSTVIRYDRDVYRLKPGKTVTIRFMTDPGQMYDHSDLCLRSTEDGSWANYREVAAWEDVISGKNPDGRITHVFVPVADYELTRSGTRTDRKDPIHRALRASDRELVDQKWGRPYPKAKDMLMVSVIYVDGSFGDPKYDPEPGTVILLALSPLQHQALRDEMKTATKYRPDFAFTNGEWSLTWDNPTPKNPSNWTLGLIQNEDVPPLDQTLDVLDARSVIKSVRAITEQELFGLDEALAAAEELADEEAVAEFEAVASMEEEEIIVEQPPQQIKKPASKPSTEVDNPFKLRSPAWVKGMLKKHNVEFDPRTPNDKLYELALHNLPVEIAA